MSDVVVRTEGLTKRFPGGLTAVDHLDLEVHEGDLFGFLGPNGTGKSTTIRMLLGLVFPTAGTAEVLGQRVPGHGQAALLDVGALVEGPGFYPHLSGRRNLTLIDAAGKNGDRTTRRARIDEVLERVGLADVGRRPVRAYSMGMRQRLGLAAALLRRPRLLILDEPTNGLDPQGIHELRTLFVSLVREGTTVLLSSHLLAEVELVCTRAAMMANGRLVAQDHVARCWPPVAWFASSLRTHRRRRHCCAPTGSRSSGWTRPTFGFTRMASRRRRSTASSSVTACGSESWHGSARRWRTSSSV